MNFLAHSFLSGGISEIMVGNFIADFVKGRGYLEYPEDIQKGIILHREIDHFTDKHQIVLRSKDKLRAGYRHYAGVIVDIFYDHFLAAGWSKYSDQKLLPFTEQVYQYIGLHESILPEKVQWILPHMSKNNWLFNYATIEGIQKTLSGMAKRTKYQSNMEKATIELEAHYEQFHREFHQFFPEVMAFTKNKLAQL
ncbi:MAG: ACP phosphodiesterase [Cyclobacteriaceae bacterium]